MTRPTGCLATPTAATAPAARFPIKCESGWAPGHNPQYCFLKPASRVGQAIGFCRLSSARLGARHDRPQGDVAVVRGATRSTTIRLPIADIERAQQIAERRGLPYQTYLKGLLHRALERERKAGQMVSAVGIEPTTY